MRVSRILMYIAAFLQFTSPVFPTALADDCCCGGILDFQMNSAYSQSSDHVLYSLRSFFRDIESVQEFEAKKKRYDTQGKAIIEGVPIGGSFSSNRDFQSFKAILRETTSQRRIDFSQDSHRLAVTRWLPENVQEKIIEAWTLCQEGNKMGISSTIKGNPFGIFTVTLEYRGSGDVVFLTPEGDYDEPGFMTVSPGINVKMPEPILNAYKGTSIRAGTAFTFERVELADKGFQDESVSFFLHDPAYPRQAPKNVTVFLSKPVLAPTPPVNRSFKPATIRRIALAYGMFDNCFDLAADYVDGRSVENTTQRFWDAHAEFKILTTDIFDNHKANPDTNIEDAAATYVAGVLSSYINILEDVIRGDRKHAQKIKTDPAIEVKINSIGEDNNAEIIECKAAAQAFRKMLVKLVDGDTAGARQEQGAAKDAIGELWDIHAAME